MTMDDQELEGAARRLGQRAAARLDVERTSVAVLARLKAARVAPWWGTPGLLRAAAIVVLALGLGVFYRGVGGGATTVAVASPELQTLSDDELLEVLDSLVVEAPVAYRSGIPGLADLDEKQLNELLKEMEG